ncbi:hypothetical protein ACK8QS_22685 (plasmid) [Ectopseudomonas mendocina]
MATKYVVDLNRPALSQDELASLEASIQPTQRKLLMSMILSFLAMTGFGIASVVSDTPQPLFVASLFALLIFLALILPYESRCATINRLRPIRAAECVEMAELLQHCKAEPLERYAAEVRQEGREYRVGELLVIRDYIRVAESAAVLDNAKASLYGAPPVRHKPLDRGL